MRLTAVRRYWSVSFPQGGKKERRRTIRHIHMQFRRTPSAFSVVADMGEVPARRLFASVLSFAKRDQILREKKATHPFGPRSGGFEFNGECAERLRTPSRRVMEPAGMEDMNCSC
jgi:hypothetical protein